MPQKRNPVALEHVRALASKALGQAQAIVVSVHNTPFGDIVDTEDDLQPLVHAMFRDATRGVTLTAAALTTAEFDPVRLEQMAGEGWITLTELADTLTRDHQVPFRTAHAIAAQLVQARERDPNERLSVLVAVISGELIGASLTYPDDASTAILSPRHFVKVRRTHGATAPEVAARAIADAREQLDDDRDWWNRATAALAAAERQLAERSARL